MYIQIKEGKLMKHAVNFRLSKQAITTLSLLEKKMHTSKTDIIERALQSYAKKKIANQDTLMRYAGMLNQQEADDMLENIKSSRRNKRMRVKL